MIVCDAQEDLNSAHQNAEHKYVIMALGDGHGGPEAARFFVAEASTW
jgi:serine/threonine protein phosphatase PrpC